MLQVPAAARPFSSMGRKQRRVSRIPISPGGCSPPAAISGFLNSSYPPYAWACVFRFTDSQGARYCFAQTTVALKGRWFVVLAEPRRPPVILLSVKNASGRRVHSMDRIPPARRECGRLTPPVAH